MILVIGATGYVGRYLCPFFKEKGYDVLALGRSKNAQKFFEENDVNFIHFDISNDEDYEKLPAENVDAIVNLAACLAEHETPVEKFFEINTIGVYKVLEFAINDTSEDKSWPSKPNNFLGSLFLDSYKNACGFEGTITNVHAGLECGIFASVKPDINMIAIGADVENEHGITERFYTKSLPSHFASILYVLENI